MASPDPFQRFAEVFEEAKAAIPKDPNAVVLATVGADGRPSARVMLLKGVDASGFVLFTNFESRKGNELTAHPWAALCFHWPALERQVRVEGRVERLSPEESDAYFASRPRVSQLGAWASQQSRPLGGRAELLQRVAGAALRFLGRPVERPPYWGGFRVVPDRVEFWKAQPNRLHVRHVFIRDDGGWREELLYP